MKSLQEKLKELSIQCSLPAVNSASTKSTVFDSLQPLPQPLPNIPRGGPRSLLQGKPATVASGKMRTYPHPGEGPLPARWGKAARAAGAPC